MSAEMIVIVGPMFSGKSEQVIILVKRHRIAHEVVIGIKPPEDNRQTTIRSREINESGESVTKIEIPAFAVSNAAELEELIRVHRPQVLAIDEAQFFGPWIKSALQKIIHSKVSPVKTIYVSGLDMDAWGKPFGVMGDLMAIGSEVRKITAVCTKCGNKNAGFTQKHSKGSGRIETGDKDLYEARCLGCWHPPEND